MAVESPLQKLLREKRERENAARESSSDSTQPIQTTSDGSSSVQEGSLEVEGKVFSEEDPTRLDDCAVNFSNGADLAPDPEPAPVQVVPATAVETPKPLSAIERLKQLRSGGASAASGGTQSANSTQEVKSGTESGPASGGEACEPSDVDSSRGSVSSLLGGGSSKPAAEVTQVKTSKTHPIAMEMAELEAALEAQVPGFVTILSTIHKKLKADPNVVTLLDDDEIRVIVSGLEKHTNVAIVAPSAAKAAKKRSKEPVSAEDL